MNRRILAALAMTLTLALTACGTVAGAGIAVSAIETAVEMFSPAQVQAQVETLDLAAPRAAVPGDIVETTSAGEIDWSGNTIRATGSGVIDPNNPNQAQARLMAERAAVVVAQRNLLEAAQGVRIDSETRVENFMTDFDVVYSRVEGVVRNARQVGPARYDSLGGIVEVELEMDIHSPSGLSGAVSAALSASQEQALPMTPQTMDFLNQYSALVFDGSQAGLNPSMYPKIYDSSGNLLLDTSVYASYLGSTAENAIQIVSDLNAIFSSPGFSQEPFVIQVQQVTGALGTDIVLSPEDSGSLGWLKAGLPYLAAAGKFLLGVI
ncbi:MAG TPA: hypothetical protein PLM22_00690 [Candidatus Sabulitectum sp.]|nr:hypothetical protein [Candidatus Sabulitectum sp.]HPJ27416.1 hypothetical protein [Candidatus Sabulitectum sp.]HPR21359.1 hypothetical protein [Candidatus Sabulitectum sp.]HRW78125.1 hypothetical protein [Candidatus Sabulitectum sp.]